MSGVTNADAARAVRRTDIEAGTAKVSDALPIGAVRSTSQRFVWRES